MVARVIARSELVKLRRNSIVFHILAAASDSDADLYLQIARLRDLFSIDKATGSDLDERAKDIQPGTIARRTEAYGTTQLVFSRPGTAGNLPIPSGAVGSASDNSGRIPFRTTASGLIPNGSSTSAPIAAIATVAGERANVAAGAINQLVTRIPGVTGVTNPSAVGNARSREADGTFVRRLKDYTRSLSRGTVAAIEGFARQVRLPDGSAVLFARVFEPSIPNGIIECFIDNGSGSIESFSDTYVGAIPEEDVIYNSASGGEKIGFTTQRPIRDDLTLIVRVNNNPITRNVDWAIDPTRGQIELLAGGAFQLGLTTGDKLASNYRHFTGLIQETQRVISGDPLSPLTHPGVEAGGITCIVKPAAPVFQTLTSQLTALQGFDVDQVKADIKSRIQNYINNLDCGEDVIVSEIIKLGQETPGVFNFRLLVLSGTSPAVDQVILPNQVARVQTNDIVIN